MKHGKTLNLYTFLRSGFNPSKASVKADNGEMVPRILARYSQGECGKTRSIIAGYATTIHENHIYSVIEDSSDKNSVRNELDLAGVNQVGDTIYQDNDDSELTRRKGEIFSLMIE